MYTTKEAADYLGLTLATVKYHLYKSKLLAGQKKGRDILFSKKELDEFHKSKLKRRPAKSLSQRRTEEK